MVASELTLSAFQQNVGTKFEMEVEPGKTIGVELFEVKELQSDPRAEAFSLMFRAAPTELYRGLTYRVKHAVMGDFDLFVNPVACNQRGTIYEAVFNRLKNDPGR